MEREKSQQIIAFSGNITEENLQSIPKDFNGIIEVDGNFKSNVSIRLNCSILVRGNIDLSNGDICYDFEAEGDIICYGDFLAGYVTSKSGKVYCYGEDKTYCINAEKGVSYGKNNS